MIEFEFGGKGFRADRLNAFQQFHVSRKIAPLIPALIPVFLEVQKRKGKLQDNIGEIAAILQPIADELAKLPDRDAEYVMSTCLSVVRRKQENNWAPVWSSQANAVMFDDMQLDTILPLVVRVIQENLAPFLAGLLTSQQET